MFNKLHVILAVAATLASAAAQTGNPVTDGIVQGTRLRLEAERILNERRRLDLEERRAAHERKAETSRRTVIATRTLQTPATRTGIIRVFVRTPEDADLRSCLVSELSKLRGIEIATLTPDFSLDVEITKAPTVIVASMLLTRMASGRLHAERDSRRRRGPG
jgi:hypothetical protein